MTYNSTPTRAASSKSIEEDIANGECRDRTFWLYISYNWDTRKRAVFLLDELAAHSEFLLDKDNHKWQRLYKVQVGLPFPAIADSRTVIELKSESIWEELDHKKPEESILYAFARRLWAKATSAFPAPWRPVESRWLGAVGNDSMQFVISRPDVRLQVTIKEIP